MLGQVMKPFMEYRWLIPTMPGGNPWIGNLSGINLIKRSVSGHLIRFAKCFQ